MTYSFAIADGDRPTPAQIANFHQDSRRTLAATKQNRSRKDRASIRFSLNAIFSRLTPSNSTVSLLLIGATSVTLLVSHGAYA